MTSEEKIMSQLIEYSYERMLKQNAYPFCAFVVRDGVVVSKGYNNVTNSWGDKTTHGEMVAIRKALQALQVPTLGQEYHLYSTCECCLACLDTALFQKLGKLVFSVSQTDFPDYFNDHKCSFQEYMGRVADRPHVVDDVLKDEGLHLFLTAKRKYGW